MMKEKPSYSLPISMSESRVPELGINSWLEDELYQRYLNDRKNVDESWKEVFDSNGGDVTEAPVPGPANGSHPQQQQAVSLHNGGSSAGGSAATSAVAVPEHRPV